MRAAFAVGLVPLPTGTRQRPLHIVGEPFVEAQERMAFGVHPQVFVLPRDLPENADRARFAAHHGVRTAASTVVPCATAGGQLRRLKKSRANGCVARAGRISMVTGGSPDR